MSGQERPIWKGGIEPEDCLMERRLRPGEKLVLILKDGTCSCSEGQRRGHFGCCLVHENRSEVGEEDEEASRSEHIKLRRQIIQDLYFLSTGEWYGAIHANDYYVRNGP